MELIKEADSLCLAYKVYNRGCGHQGQETELANACVIKRVFVALAELLSTHPTGSAAKNQLWIGTMTTGNSRDYMIRFRKL